MRKLLLLFITLALILSIIPPITTAAPLTQYYINGGAVYSSTIAYATYGNYAIYGYILYGSGNIALAVVDNTGSLILNKQLYVSGETYYKYVSMDLDANDTGILIVYRDDNADIRMYWVDYSGTEKDLGLVAGTSDYEGLPVVKYGNGYWLIAYVDSSKHYINVSIYDLSLKRKATGIFGNLYGVDYRERAFYDPVTQKFYIVVKNYTLKDLMLIIVDPSTSSITYRPITVDGTTTEECYQYYNKLFRRYYAKLLQGGGKLLIVYGYYDGSTNITGKIIDLTSLTNTTVTLSTEGGDDNIYPWIGASSSEWLVVWSYSNAIYARVVYPNGTLSAKWIIASGQYGFVTCTYNSVDYTIVYGNQTTGNYDLYAIRIDTTGKRTLNPFLIAGSSDNERYDYPLNIDSKVTVLYYNDTAHKGYVAVFDYTEVSEPSAIPTAFTDIQYMLNDGGDGYMESGDYISVTGTLKDLTTDSGLAFKTVYVYLYRYVFYNKESHSDEDELVATKSLQTNNLGNFNGDIYIPNNIKSGIYYIKIEFLGEDPYAPTSWSSQPEFFIAGPVKPSSITWETIPSDIATGPAMLIKNGQVMITDPGNEVSTNNRFGVSMSDILGSEVNDVDIRSLQLAVDNNYLYVKATFAGTVTADGNIAPVLSMAFDFTPETIDDGAEYNETGNMPIVYGMGYSDTYLKGGTAWDWVIVATPKDKKEYVFQDTFGKYTLYMYIAHQSGGMWYYRELDAGYVVLNGNTIEIYAPLDIVKTYNPHITTSGISAWKMFAAVFAVNLTDGYKVGAPGANWFDVPGIVTTNSTPPSYLDIGRTESPTDDPKYPGPTYELDTYFILNINWSSNKFFGYTKLSYKYTYLDVDKYGKLTYNDLRAFIGTTHYMVKLVDANNTFYGVYGKDIGIYIDNVLKKTATTSVIDNVVGYGDIGYKWLNTTLGNNYEVKFMFTGDSDYIGSETSIYNVTPIYLVEVVGGQAYLVNNDDIPTASPGDTIEVELAVNAWNDEWIPAPTGLKFRVYLNSTPYYLGEAVVTSPGRAVLSYTVTGDEGLYDGNYTGHEIIIYGYDGSTWLVNVVAVNFPYSLGMIPMPEPPILPLILLLALILLIIITKKK